MGIMGLINVAASITEKGVFTESMKKLNTCQLSCKKNIL